MSAIASKCNKKERKKADKDDSGVDRVHVMNVQYNLRKSVESGRVEYIDLFRAFGILLMIMGHIKFGGIYSFVTPACAF